MRTLVIHNPAAGGGGAPSALLKRIRSAITADFKTTRGPGDASTLAAEAAETGYEAVVAVGGDGTVREIVTGLHRAGGGPRLGIVPAGTGNDLAASLGLPRNVEEASRIAIGGRSADLDLIQATAVDGEDERRVLANAAVAGFGGRIGDRMSPALRRFLRPIAYPLAALGQLRDLRPYSVSLDIDGRSVQEKALMLIVANGTFAGGKLPLAPGATTDDGLLDLIVLRAVGPAGLATMVPRVLAGRHRGHPGVSVHRARRVRIRSDPPMWTNLDGDTWRSGASLFEVLPAALRVAVP